MSKRDEIGAVLNGKFRRIANVGLDERKRISLTKALDALKEKLGEAHTGLRFAIYANEAGQLLLSPEVSVPMHELWLYRNPDALKMVAKGLEEARAGKVTNLGSFEKFADDDID